jgi:hypothetical protein
MMAAFSSSGVHSPENPPSENWAETTSFLNRATTENADYGAVNVNVNGGINSGSADAYVDANQEAPAAVQVEDEAAEDEASSATTDQGEENRDGAIGTLTRRLRCLFSTITWPIVPLGTIVALALLWVLYAASSLDLRRSCSHPLHWYALASLILVAYIPHHAQVRSHIFQYIRERDGPIRPTRVRMYDQFFHTVCLLYVYTGVTLIQTCREDLVGNESVSDIINAEDMQIPKDVPLNTCAATCPNLYQALSVYVATLEMFTFALILPLLFLPCIYLWFLRRATAEAEAFAQLQDRLQEEEALLSNGGVTAKEILDSLENVKLVSRRQTDAAAGDNADRQVWLLPSSATDASIGMNSDVKECCICMSDFPVQDEADLEDGLLFDETAEEETSKDPAAAAPGNLAERGIVRTKCGHIFHKECLSGWVGGRWQMNPQTTNEQQQDENQAERRRRARQTCCPLCREDLRPASESIL